MGFVAHQSLNSLFLVDVEGLLEEVHCLIQRPEVPSQVNVLAIRESKCCLFQQL